MPGRLSKKLPKQEKRRASQRYIFGHSQLPGLFFSNAARFMATLQSDEELFLRFIWKRAGDIAGVQDEPVGIQLACEFVTLPNDVAVAVITCPAPHAMTEPFFVAAAYRPGSDTEPQKRPITRWFTLEYSLNTEKDGIAFFCEWTAQRAHVNCGPLAETTRKAFLQAVSSMVGPESDRRPLRPAAYTKPVRK